MRSFRFVRRVCLVCCVNFMPCVLVRFWFWVSSSIGSPIPVWSMRVLFMWKVWFARARCPMTFVYDVFSGNWWM